MDLATCILNEIEREGREAFDENTLPEDLCPYRGNPDSPRFKIYYWFAGWKKAEQQLMIEQILEGLKEY